MAQPDVVLNLRGGAVERLDIRVLVVDDFQPFRVFVCSALRKKAEFEDIHEAADGLEAIQKAEELQPDLIVLDIGLPTVNGIEAARQIRRLSANSKIIFVSQESSPDVVEEALSLGAWGYVVKAHAGSELLPAVQAVCEGRRFVSNGLSGHNAAEAMCAPASNRFGHQDFAASRKRITRNHEAEFFPNDGSFQMGLTRFIEAAFKIRNPVILVATPLQQRSILESLEARGWDVVAARRDGSYRELDPIETLATFMVKDWPDPDRFRTVATHLILQAAKAAKGEHPRVAACGVCAPTLWAEGKRDAAIQVERLWDEIARSYDVDVLCGYVSTDFERQENSHLYERICREHSVIRYH
jgi:DNA-binding NarL/FixJ family response regulator